jgi:hypothetical protein
MQSNAARPASPTYPRRRLLALVDGPYPARDDFRARWIAARAQAAEVLVVAPALPIPGERWIIDLDARRARARANLTSWTDALGDEAASVQGESAHPGLGARRASRGRDVNSSSVIAWVIARGGIDAGSIEPPSGGHAPGWHAGLIVAARDGGPHA